MYVSTRSTKKSPLKKYNKNPAEAAGVFAVVRLAGWLKSRMNGVKSRMNGVRSRMNSEKSRMNSAKSGRNSGKPPRQSGKSLMRVDGRVRTGKGGARERK